MDDQVFTLYGLFKELCISHARLLGVAKFARDNGLACDLLEDAITEGDSIDKEMYDFIDALHRDDLPSGAQGMM